MLGMAFGLSAGVDVVTLDGDIGRMNTVFKFYLHIWVLLALAGSFTAWYLLAVFRPPSLASLASRLRASWPAVLRLPSLASLRSRLPSLWAAAATTLPDLVREPPTTIAASAAACSRAAAFLASLARAQRPPQPTFRARALSLRSVWIGTLALLLFATFLYPAAATPARVQDRFGNGGHTNNGLAFMEDAVYQDEGGPVELKYDRDAIDWLRNNVAGSPVIIEASTVEYRWGSRFSIYTGLPTVVGWRWHQTQQRGSFAPMVDARLQDVSKFYTTTDPVEAEAILHKYGVSLVILGQVEQLYYPGAGLDKFDDMEGNSLELVYENPKTKIYRVVEENLTPLVSVSSP